jgi:hypothetical protein
MFFALPGRTVETPRQGHSEPTLIKWMTSADKRFVASIARVMKIRVTHSYVDRGPSRAMAPTEYDAIKGMYPEPSGTEYGNPAGVKTGGVYRIWGM